ncbi:MAG: serine hydrolase domain-containing protein [Paracoccaceae bacterium]
MSARSFHTAWIDRDGGRGCRGERDALFPWWSFTKTVIALCALRLAEDGRVDLDEPVAGRLYTLRLLLQHRAGVPDYGRLAAYHEAVGRGEDAWSRERLLEAVRPDEPLFAPGTGWAYSNVGYLLARDLLEERAGCGFSTLVADLVSRPLGLDSVRLATRRAEFAALHWPAAKHYDPAWVSHGCLIGTASDAATLLHEALAGDFLDPRTRATMLATHALGDGVPGRPWTRHGYALGLMRGTMAGAGEAIGHSGSGPFSVNAVYHFPDRAGPVTVACFADGAGEAAAEVEAARLASVL